MTMELSKYEERDALQMNELTNLRQSTVLLEQEKLNFQVEIDSLRAKLIEEELQHQNLQEQFCIEKLKHVTPQNSIEDDIKLNSQEIIKGIYSCCFFL
ncbi:unnamed protein product [Rotaria sp. Silwood2]|nr:unnamed protein product [Rotaria sp. Silwood2]